MHGSRRPPFHWNCDKVEGVSSGSPLPSLIVIAIPVISKVLTCLSETFSGYMIREVASIKARVVPNDISSGKRL